jgi:DNA polymerase-3 subunit alpha
VAISYIHLRLHSEFSLIDGLVRLDALAEQVAQSMPAVALTDYMNLFAVVKFFSVCEKQGVKPIIGAELVIANSLNQAQPFHLLALCQDATGYANLRCLISKAYREGQTQGLPLIEFDWLKHYSQGLIILSGAQKGEIARALEEGDTQEASKIALVYQEIFPDRFYIELQRIGREGEKIGRASCRERV